MGLCLPARQLFPSIACTSESKGGGQEANEKEEEAVGMAPDASWGQDCG